MKSSSTIIKRSWDIQRLYSWHQGNSLPSLPSQRRTYGYALLNFQHFLALQLYHHYFRQLPFVFLFWAVQLTLHHFPSPRIKGITANHRASGAPVQHAIPLTVQQIKQLEIACHDATEFYDSLLISTILEDKCASNDWWYLFVMSKETTCARSYAKARRKKD